jgi:hypothetical protein
VVSPINAASNHRFTTPVYSPHFRRVRVAISSNLDAEAGCVGAFGCSRLKWARGWWNGIWGVWGFDDQIGFY